MELNEFVCDDYRNKNRFGANYFFVSTFFVIMANVLIFANRIDFGMFIEIDNASHWDSVLYFNRLAISFLNSFGHLSLQHVLLNMLCFSVCGIYLERKIGSIKFVLLILALAFFSSSAITASNISLNWRGFSGVNYALYFFIIVDFLFSLRKASKKRHNIIIGAIVLFLIYVAFCFSGGTGSFAFRIYPYDLMTNLGHYSSALVGLVVGLFIQITHLKTTKENIS